MNITILVLIIVVAILLKQNFCYQKKLNDIIPSNGVRLENCLPGKYQVVGQILVDAELREIPSGLSKHYALVYEFGNESNLFLLSSQEALDVSPTGTLILGSD
jgi:hypothetical protein